MCAHTDNLCVSDFIFYVHIHMPSQKAFRTDHIDLTPDDTNYCLPDRHSTRDQQHGMRHSAPSEAAMTTAAAPTTSPAVQELLRLSAAASEPADRVIHAAKTARR